MILSAPAPADPLAGHARQIVGKENGYKSDIAPDNNTPCSMGPAFGLQEPMSPDACAAEGV